MAKLHRSDIGPSEKLARYEARDEREKTKERRMGKMAIGAAEATGTAVALGAVHGRLGGMPNRFKITLDGAVAGIGLGLGITGAAGKYSDDAFFVGLGAASYFGGWLGIGIGQKWRDKAGKMTGKAYTADEGKAQNLSVRTITAGGPRFGVHQGGGFVGATAR